MREPLPPKEEIAKLPPDGGPKYNRLIHEKSPYLLQHAANPVDWYPWGDEAFVTARSLEKPIFLSIGYSTCHWCHVMERESFEDEQVASLLNEHFVCIKVDREERPDVDHVYMTATQALTGQGGWPTSIFMTPDRKPFFAGTYFPKHGMGGRPGMMDLVRHIGRLWKEQAERLEADAEQATRQLEAYATMPAGEGVDLETLKSAYDALSRMFDPEHGGFGTAPKFPTPHVLTFLLRYWARTGEAHALAMVEKTLSEMRLGGLFDHVGFGFHRYSTDRVWLLPHFEKMLYDQALLAVAYVEAYQATGKEQYARVAREVLAYVLRDMTSPQGGFYSAEDADSEGEEGLFYLWSAKELKAVLGSRDADLFVKLFNIERGGNFRDQTTGERTGKSIPHLKAPLDELAEKHGFDAHELKALIASMRDKLFEAREGRVHPLKDDKILTDWNGLMIASLSKAGRVLGEERYTTAASRAAEFVLAELRDGDGRLLKRYRNGDAGLPAHLDDYAFMTWGLLELYESTFEVKHLRAAVELTDTMLDLFWDDDGAGLYMTADDGEKLLLRSKEAYDGAIPSGNSVAALNLLRLHRMVAEETYGSRAEALLKEFSSLLDRGPSGFCQLLNAADFSIGPSVELVIAGKEGGEDVSRMLAAVRQAFAPNMVVLFRPDGEADPEIAGLAEYAREQRAIEGKATAYVCRNFACKAPMTDPSEVLEDIGAARAG